MSQDDLLYSEIRIFKPTPDGARVEVSNTAVQFPQLKMQTVPGKAALANAVSCHFHGFLADQGVPTHFIERSGQSEQKVYDTEQLPFEIVIRNAAGDDIVDTFGLEKGARFPEPLIEFFLRPDPLDNQPTRVSEAHLISFDILNPQELDEITATALRINDLLMGAFFGIGVRLVDIRMEFGVHSEETEEAGLQYALLLSSEISPDTMTLWDLADNAPLDSSLVFAGSGDPLKGYTDVANRLGLLSAKSMLSGS